MWGTVHFYDWSYNMSGIRRDSNMWMYWFDVTSVKWCAVEQKGHSEALRCRSAYPGGLIGGTGLTTWGPRCLVGPLLHTCQRERRSAPSTSWDYKHSSMYRDSISTSCVSLSHRHNWIKRQFSLIKHVYAVSMWLWSTAGFELKTFFFSKRCTVKVSSRISFMWL